MRIKQLELVGFKSFKDRTTLTFPRGITAVVGPNGCGKSNIVDALRWVLGEQSAKHLRGQEMSDVVFAGNEQSAPLGMADVSLLLENVPPVPVQAANGTNGQPPPARLNGHNGSVGIAGNGHDWTEVMVSRRYFRSGDAEYLFNKLPCRLRDIVEFFLGTGAGTKAYSIIEQGRVEALINAKPDEIRALVEEAAGVSLFRSRRLAAERKLDRTRDNLSRVADLLHEMGRQLGSLRRQAKKAERYRTLKDELRTIDLTLSCRTYSALLDEIRGLQERRGAFERDGARLDAQARTLHAERTAAAERAAAAQAALRALEEDLRQLEHTIQQARQRQEFLSQQQAQFQARIAAAEKEGASIREKKNDLRREIAEREALGRQVFERQEQAEVALRDRERTLDAVHEVMQGHEAQVEECKTDIVEALTRATNVQHTLTNARARGEDVAKRLATLAQESDQLDKIRADAERASAALHEQTVRMTAEAEQRQQRCADKRAALRGLLADAERIESDLSAARDTRAELRARLQTLQDLERGYERYGQGVQAVMADPAFPASVRGVVAQVIDVPHAYERAVAAVLREKLEYMVVADAAAGVVAVDHLTTAQAGYGSFVPLQSKADGRTASGNDVPQSEPWATSGVSRLIEHVGIAAEYRPMLERLLGDAVLVPDLQVGLDLWDRSRGSYTYVTPRGEVISAPGIVSGGSGDVTEASLLGRRREIRDLRQTLEEQEARVARLVREQQTLKQRQTDGEAELGALETGAQELDREREANRREAERLESELQRAGERGEGVVFERNVLEQERASLQQDGRKAEAEASAIAARRQECEARLAATQAELADAKRALDRERSQVGDLRVRVAEQRERREGIQAQLAQLTQQFGELDQRIRACRAEIQTAERDAARVRSDAAALAERTAHLTADLDAKRQARAQQQPECDRLAAACRQCDAQIEENRQAASKLHEEKAQLDVSLAERRVGRDHLEATVRERYHLELPRVVDEYRSSDIDQAEAETRREELRDAIARLGEVNPNAAQELVEVEERVADVESQKADLTGSIEDLQTTIDKLNRESRDRFRDTFRRVDEKFRDVYARLVEGGKARIVLTDDGDLTEAGVEIEVQPSGKRLRSMQLLSGGEKALAALSFTFALFLIRPSPFCILDEVDAPLDDANVGRFNQLLREMSETTQIVLITHNKRTMRAADTLYGVTMQEPGISTIVSVQVSDPNSDPAGDSPVERVV